MPTYKADLEWLRHTHPCEYARIPDRYLDYDIWKQQHGSFVENGQEHWVISFYPVDPTANDDGEDIELSIPRPAPDESPDYCRDHTLDVSRRFCKACASK